MSERTLAGRRIMVVEDEYFLADELSRALEAAAAAVLGPVATVATALDLLAQEAAPDAAVLDVNLGGEMAFPVADAFMARGVPFVFTTGYDQEALPVRYAAARRLEKPIATAGTMRELARLLAAAEPGAPVPNG